MTSLLLTLILQLQGSAVPPPTRATLPSFRLKEAVRDFPRSQLQLKHSDPVSVDLNQSARASYETLAELAGVNIIFDRDFQNDFFPPLRVEKADILEAFDRLSAVTGNFVEVFDSNTLLVAPNNAAKRLKYGTYGTQVVKTIYLTSANSQQDTARIVTALRTLNMRLLATGGDQKAIVIKDTPDRMAVAAKLVSELAKIDSSEPIAVDPAGNLLIQDGGGMRKSASRRSRLDIRVANFISLNVEQDARSMFEAVAARAGLNILFDRDFQSPGSVRLKFENMDVLDTLDLLALQTGTFWEALDSTTILVAPDNQTKRRDYAPMIEKTLYLDNMENPKQLTEIITCLRAVLNMRYLFSSPTAKAIAMKDTPNQIALAEKIIADLGSATTTEAPTSAGTALDVGSELPALLRSRAVRNLSANHSQLDARFMETVSIDLNESAQRAFEELTGKVGLHVTFDKRLEDAPAGRLTLKDVRIVDALDFLSLQTRTFWNVKESSGTILVAPDTQAVRQELEPRTEKVIPLRNIQTPVGTVEIVTALRTLLNNRYVEGNANGIVLKDTSDNTALVEKLVADLDRLPRY